jgi:hypothetical protein
MIGSALRTAGRRAFASAAHAGENPQWREVYKRTPVYIALILTGAVITEVIFGKFTGLLWRSANRGVRRRSVSSRAGAGR